MIRIRAALAKTRRREGVGGGGRGWRLWALAALVGLLSGCVSPGEVGPTQESASPTQGSVSPTHDMWHIPPELEGTAWELVELNGQPPIAGSEITLEFVDGKARGYAGCNWYNGPYPSTGNQTPEVRFTITVRDCPDAPAGVTAQEQAYVDTLNAAAGRRVVDGRLGFTDEAGQVALVFQPLQATPVARPTTPAPEATPTPSPATKAAPAARLAPIAEAAAVRFDSWSPDSQWAAYWLSTADDLAQMTGNAPPATLHLYNVVSGESCARPQFTSQQYGSQLAWLPNGQVVVTTANPPQQGQPCAGEFAAAVHPWPTPAPTPDPAMAPGGGYIAATTILDGSSGLLELSTTISAADGQIVNTVEWSIDQRLGELGLGGEWISERLFLIYETVGQGPLLVEAGGAVIQVARDLFGVPADPGWPDMWYTARAIRPASGSGYHLLLSASGAEHLFPPVRLYHAENGQVEELQYTHLWGPPVSPDGARLLLDARPERDGYERYEMWTRRIDPPGSAARRVGEGTALWSPDGASLVFGRDNTFSIVAFPSGELRRNGEVSAAFSLYPRAWSPNGAWVAFEGSTGRPEQAVFIVPLED